MDKKIYSIEEIPQLAEKGHFGPLGKDTSSHRYTTYVAGPYGVQTVQMVLERRYVDIEVNTMQHTDKKGNPMHVMPMRPYTETRYKV